MDTSDLAKRMKQYEHVSQSVLMRRMPVIMRLDGKAFHTFTRGFERPFDKILVKSMQETMKYLCQNIQGCVLGYTQSDEITLVLVDYKKLTSDAWFDNEVQKMCSIGASMATMAFNKSFLDEVDLEYSLRFDEIQDNQELSKYEKQSLEEELENTFDIYYDKVNKAMFDCRVFNLPKEEVTNCIYWRQLDASRNSIQMVGQASFSHRELMNKTCNQIQDMLMTQREINWNDLDTTYKRGSCCVKEEYFEPNEDGKYVKNECGEAINGVRRTKWVIDNEIPIFKGDGRAYIDDLVFVGEE